MPTQKKQVITIDISHCGDKKKAATFFHETTCGLFAGSKCIKKNSDGTITATVDPKKISHSTTSYSH